MANIVVIVNKNADDYANVVASAIDLDDRVAPKVASVTATTVVFSEKVTKATAEDEDNYVISGTAVDAAQTVATATLGADEKTVTLTFSAALDTAVGKTLTITVTGVKDLAGNTIAGSNSGTHTF
ncbi:MAG: Ig-like domain-containing protein [Syntrophomonadaceae bacterium]